MHRLSLHGLSQHRLSLLALIAALAAPTAAYAHGRESSLGQIVFHPSDSAHIVARGTWGTLTSRDEGETWAWQCADAVPFDRMREDPMFAFLPSGTLLAATFDGIARSDESQCGWPEVEAAPRGEYTPDVTRDLSDGVTAWAIVSPGATPDRVYRASDDGRAWAVVSMPHPTALTDRILVAPSDGSRIYTSGVVPATETEERTGIVLRSDDRGETFTPVLLPLEGEERTAHLLAVDPTNADRVFVRMVRRVTDEVPERVLLSEDGGETWTTVLELLEIVGFAVSEDGQRAWAGSWDGGFVRSTDGGRSFEMLDPALNVRCVGYRPGEVWVCADSLTEPFAIARSTDDGETLVPLWAFENLVNDVGCAPDTRVGEICPAYWPDMQYDLGRTDVPPDDLDAGPTRRDAGMETPIEPEPTESDGGCACAAAGASRAGLGAWLAPLALGLALWRRRRAPR